MSVATEEINEQAVEKTDPFEEILSRLQQATDLKAGVVSILDEKIKARAWKAEQAKQVLGSYELHL